MSIIYSFIYLFVADVPAFQTVSINVISTTVSLIVEVANGCSN